MRRGGDKDGRAGYASPVFFGVERYRVWHRFSLVCTIRFGGDEGKGIRRCLAHTRCTLVAV